MRRSADEMLQFEGNQPLDSHHAGRADDEDLFGRCGPVVRDRMAGISSL